ncbi:uncharacterized protein [Nicotiana tomentosiformis]|uniref:uncharacterized protein n=1 Tax=Nicotiana tomentosiformis TaxID=4098 RepID=UPI000877F767
MAQSHQKSYSDVRRREFTFKDGEFVFLKVPPMKGVMRFVKKGKLNPRFIGLYNSLKKIGDAAYELDLPQELSSVHPVFQVSMLREYLRDPSHVISPQTIEINEGLIYEELPIAILDKQVRKLRIKKIASVKVLWRSQDVEEARWEAE